MKNFVNFAFPRIKIPGLINKTQNYMESNFFSTQINLSGKIFPCFRMAGTSTALVYETELNVIAIFDELTGILHPAAEVEISVAEFYKNAKRQFIETVLCRN